MSDNPVLLSAAEPQRAREAEITACRCGPHAPTIFHEEWWLDTATGGNFDVIEVTSGGRVVGRLPVSTTRRFGLKMIRMPNLTYFLGPAIDEGEGSSNTRFLRRLEITRELLKRLPRASWQYIKCHGGIREVIAFQELGFRTYVQFTHQIPPDSTEALWEQMRNKTRNVIRKAQDLYSVAEWPDPAAFFRHFERNLERKGLQNGINKNFCLKTITAALDRRRGRILAARDKNKQIVAANFCVWDEVSAFYILSTRCDGSGNSAGSLALWEAIKESAHRGLVFDFAGLGSKGSILLYSGFGGSVSPRYVALRAQPIARILNQAKQLLEPENFFY